MLSPALVWALATAVQAAPVSRPPAKLSLGEVGAVELPPAASAAAAAAAAAAAVPATSAAPSAAHPIKPDAHLQGAQDAAGAAAAGDASGVQSGLDALFEKAARGPWLSEVTQDSAVVRWRDEGASDYSARTLSGLAPGAPFEYALPGHPRPYTGRTLPGPGQPVRLVFFGDSGEGKPVQERVAAQVGRLDPDLLLHGGDVVYPRGEDKDYDARFFRPYAALLPRYPLRVAWGNHDYGDPDAFARVHGARKYETFRAGDVQLFKLDTNAAFGSPGAEPVDEGSEQVRWLERELAASKAPWKIVFLHVGLYSSGLHGSNERLQRAVEPLLRKYGVDLVLQAHDHDYERTEPIGGVVYVTAGTGGARLYAKVSSHPWSKVFALTHGAVSVSVDGGRLELRMIDDAGRAVDSFTLDKPRA